MVVDAAWGAGRGDIIGRVLYSGCARVLAWIMKLRVEFMSYLLVMGVLHSIGLFLGVCLGCIGWGYTRMDRMDGTYTDIAREFRIPIPLFLFPGTPVAMEDRVA